MSRLESLQSRLQMYLDCEIAILEGAQSYQIGAKQLNRANLSHIRIMIEYLEKEIAQEESKIAGKGRNRTVGVIPRDF
ncbi:hypothetical protein E4K67_17410 [Desulfosporosinus fructosivorans]|uniref:Uncharacterized protein n=1 Tax=Desulfosporosinus fructosivorans TaxID=2018669 RepID=A0A4Z0R4E6_9FIRM|nr:DUF6148 family protein [Desulfosporosinus fructosivorans]TGE36877.1 hypothetical protein E4K67_17410 [Desulfosporosinus fructosivorans]